MSTVQDPLARPPSPGRDGPERLNYALGVMLGADDFHAEQHYHRSRLARVCRYLHGRGTVAGLELGYRRRLAPAEDPAFAEGRPEELEVSPGLALDLLGRLVEVPERQCIRLERWFEQHGAQELERAFTPSAADPDLGELLADVFLEFRACARGLTPAFASGPYDATDAVVPARIRDEFALKLVLRERDQRDLPAHDVPEPERLASRFDELHLAPDRGAQELLELLRASSLGAWREGTQHWGLLEPERPRHVPLTVDATAVFLGRVIFEARRDPGAEPEILRGATTTLAQEGREVVLGAATVKAWAARVETTLAELQRRVAALEV